MSDNGYDNVELNDLINDLKNVGDKTSSCKNTEKITFQFTNPTRDSKSHREENIGFAQHCKRDINKNNNELHLNRSEVYTLQRELSIVKQELALLKRSQSLASHPIFSENLSDNRKMNFETEKDMNLNLYPDFKQLNLRNPGKFSGTSNILRNNFSSVTNIACQTSNSNKMQYQSLTRLNSPLSYSAHRENLEKVRLLPIDCNLRMPQENNPQLSNNDYSESQHRSRHFGATIQLTADIESEFATSTNWSAVNQSLCEKVHMLGVECDINSALYQKGRDQRKHDHDWHVDLAQNYLELADQIADLQKKLVDAKEDSIKNQRELRRVTERLRRRDWRCRQLWEDNQRLDPANPTTFPTSLGMPRQLRT